MSTYVTGDSSQSDMWEEIKRLRDMCRKHEAAKEFAEHKAAVAQSTGSWYKYMYEKYNVMPKVIALFTGNDEDKAEAGRALKALAYEYMDDN